MTSLQYNDTTFWESKLGLLPIKLFHSPTNTIQNKFIMLNGMSNNFCLDLDIDTPLSNNDYFSHAWSCDVGSFVKISEERVQVFNWGRQEKIENYDKKVVFERLESFYKYLGEKQIPKENTIVPFATNIFRSLRNEFGESEHVETSLKAFLYILAFIENGERQLSDFSSWGLDGIDNHILSLISPYADEFQNGIKYYDLKPNMSLILRHVSGKLFQEAHYLATLDRQRTLWGTASSHINIQPEKYSTVHFTPSFVARSIVEEVLDSFSELPKSLKIFDPAMGSGEFLKEVLRQLKNRNYQGKIKVIGWDISKLAIDMAKFVLAFEQKEWEINQVTINLEVVENSLSQNWDNEFDIILMNPPFLSWELLSENDRIIIHDILGNNYQKNPNMASAFFWKATIALANNGVLGCVMPTSILNADSYKNLRNSVEDFITPRLIAKLGNYIFQNALTDACFYVGQKNKHIDSTKIVWTYNVANAAADALRSSRKLRFSKSTVINEENYSVYYNDVPHQNWTPLSFNGIELRKNLEKGIENFRLTLVKNIFDVKQGARIGSPIFVIDEQFLKQLPSREKRFFRPVSQNKNIKSGQLSIIDYLFYPNTEGLENINSEDYLKNTLPIFYEHKLLPNKEALINRATYINWWSLSRDRAWQRKKEPKLISTEFGRAGSFAYDKAGDMVVERGCAWLRLPRVNENFSEDTNYAYLAIFCSDFFNELLGIYSKQISGRNWWDLSKRYSDNIPIPDLTIPNAFTSQEFSLLSDIGKKLSKGLELDKNLLAKVVKTIYGLL